MAVARTEAASLPSIPSPHSSRDKWWDQGVVDVEKDKVLGVDRGWTCVSQVRAESHTAGQGRPGLRLNVWGMAQDSGLGIQWQWKSQTAVQYGNMSELCLASHLSECACVCVGGCLCGLAYVCVSCEFMPTLCLVASRDGAGLASCWGTQEAELEENMTYIAIREKRILSFHNAHRSTLHTDVYSIQMHNMFSFCSDIIS